MKRAKSVPAMASPTLKSAAKGLIARLSSINDPKYAFSTASVEIYDTAWVAMVTKGSGEQKRWLFPESFYHLLKSQADDGSWGYHPQTKASGILGTGAAVLALYKHLKEPLQLHDVSSEEIRKRIILGSESLRTQLQNWDDVLTTNHIGIEIVAPALLDYLKQEDPALDFEFPAQAGLREMNAQKMSRFKPEHLYEAKVSTAAHSLEAFVGKIDFDRVRGHLWRGSMMASPSSTAAYLMYASVWDDEAEGFLQHVLKAGAGHGDGSMPGTFPTSYFEYSWTVVTLLQGGFSITDLGVKELNIIADHLEDGFKEEGGIIGFAPRAPDADDTAKGLLALDLLGRHLSPDRMIKVFEGRNHFTTFGSERDPSLTSNCHILLALLQQPDVAKYYPQIIKTANFICEYWWSSDRRIRDKWHLSHIYPTMLMAEAFTELLGHFDNGTYPKAADGQLIWRVCICLFQACHRTLLEQGEDGSWEGMPEQTSYAILALAQARKLSLFDGVGKQVQAAIDRGAHYLKTRKGGHHDASWTSKSAYRVAIVAEAYELAALNVQKATRDGAPAVGRSIELPISGPRLDGYVDLVAKTPLFSDVPQWQLRASLVEASLFVPLLRDQRLSVFSRDEFDASEDKYLEMIPFTWVSCSNRGGSFMATSWLYDMMLVSMLSYQADEFIHKSAAPALRDISALSRLIDGVFDELASESKHVNGKSTSSSSSSEAEIKVRAELLRFVGHLLGHPSLARSSHWDLEALRRELRACLQANVAQIEENSRLAKHPSSPVLHTRARRTFFDWVRTTASDRTAIAFPFYFACCHFSSSQTPGEDVFATAAEKYLVDAAIRHLATKGRLMNDFGSTGRDSAEGNVNSVHFPELQRCSAAAASSTPAAKKVVLQRLIEFEEHCCSRALELLSQACLDGHERRESLHLQKRKVVMPTVYRDVSELYGQLYMLKGAAELD
ncbi:hypothetical protein MCOR27_008909 [Pyricularia oryzae]|uniref:Ent-kaurene synthase n=1 Tax=Pyricularia grisea TaxID=148305 RepID=A0ABQ8NP89_PYRGI|nr:hypothetical protein MCOR01_011426 [Pyricularia oryzae]KAI6300132.1 hypothetical protein MCOR33_004116 [Pyricularia grisea]KAI6271230.1 hypothetical protein MCOR27_008909 [Pyricularia oryzae]KAI6278423.1 hypothetical protein MCOR26_004695 [Pyricularia oryzae]KAI6308086.1 hypothetical protein MCOR30_011572 [Pyricularia oryzae]